MPSADTQRLIGPSDDSAYHRLGLHNLGDKNVEAEPTLWRTEADFWRRKRLLKPGEYLALMLVLLMILLSSSTAVILLWNCSTCPHIANERDIRSESNMSRQPLYRTPKLDLITYQPEPGAWKGQIYNSEPSRASDLAWRKLQTVRGVWVSPEEANELNISSLALDNGKVPTILGVMHNIHCLRIIRQTLHSKHYYPNATERDYEKMIGHVGHCLEAIRQSVMCTPDLVPRAVSWEDEKHENVALNPSARQQCVDWDSLVRWERQRSWNLDDIRRANP